MLICSERVVCCRCVVKIYPDWGTKAGHGNRATRIHQPTAFYRAKYDCWTISRRFEIRWTSWLLYAITAFFFHPICFHYSMKTVSCISKLNAVLILVITANFIHSIKLFDIKLFFDSMFHVFGPSQVYFRCVSQPPNQVPVAESHRPFSFLDTNLIQVKSYWTIVSDTLQCFFLILMKWLV